MSGYSRQILGITGTEPPLTDDDIRAAVDRALDSWRGDAILRGWGHDVRRGDWSCGEPIGSGRRSVSCHADHRGLLVRVTDDTGGQRAIRVGHVPWRTAETVLRALREPGQTALFNLAAVGAA